MKRQAILAAAAIWLAASAAAQAQPAAGVSVQRGRQLVQRNCGMCHAVGAKGQSPNKVAPPFRDLGMRYPIDALQEALVEGMLTGHPAMPEFRFTPAETNDIIAYIKSIQVRSSASLGRAAR
jgi:mono/diheme cytochrome c family protein